MIQGCVNDSRGFHVHIYNTVRDISRHRSLWSGRVVWPDRDGPGHIYKWIPDMKIGFYSRYLRPFLRISCVANDSHVYMQNELFMSSAKTPSAPSLAMILKFLKVLLLHNTIRFYSNH